jgi:hypothetical protein
MKLHAWLTSSMIRVYPSTQPQSKKRMALLAARGERISFQVAYRVSDSVATFHVSLSCDDPAVRIRRVGYVPVPHHNAHSRVDELEGALPGMVPDVLFPDAVAHVGANETHGFWVTVTVPVDAKPEDRAHVESQGWAECEFHG